MIQYNIRLIKVDRMQLNNIKHIHIQSVRIFIQFSDNQNAGD